MGWRILDFTQSEVSLGTQRGNLVVKSNTSDHQQLVPFADVDVVLIGLGTGLTSGVLHQLVQYDCVTLFTDWKFVPVGGVYPYVQESTHNRIAARQLAQANASKNTLNALWQQMVRAKIQGQVAVMNQLGFAETSNRLKQLSKNTRPGDPSNCEGQAARFYFSSIAQIDIFQDEGWRRDASRGDWLNNNLNYGYTILRSYAIRSCLSSGLHPALGLFHRNRENLFNLADDLMEPFRPAIDYFLLSHIEELFGTDVRKELVAIAKSKFLSSGLTIPAVLNDLAQDIGMLLEHSKETVRIPSFEPLEVVST
ncbi:type II CRISPR-associated endonuclease Cas1 [Bifidobacterium crudilactis]|jgi:CRISPR-associated protein Cas1|uniref:type II CRISPR-associated endonuclease Cas1 n=1 Tax=Bifidobacterium crudilactis TaxID=327277 RepID=UPI0023567433|nr:type II CRISPR-associated endonuclease Cas1 [Bifidobacterium crudilactis]MCI1218467.1 type II CRISPR-associated endonuclease Cas1 [Bifidobacterium crudilactis]